jgi:hypothetical protein
MGEQGLGRRSANDRRLHLDRVLGEGAVVGVDALAAAGVELPQVGAADQLLAVELAFGEGDVLVRADALEGGDLTAFGAHQHDLVVIDGEGGHLAFHTSSTLQTLVKLMYLLCFLWGAVGATTVPPLQPETTFLTVCLAKHRCCQAEQLSCKPNIDVVGPDDVVVSANIDVVRPYIDVVSANIVVVRPYIDVFSANIVVVGPNIDE